MIKTLFISTFTLTATVLNAGVIYDVTSTSATFKVPMYVSPLNVPSLYVSSKTVDMYSEGTLTAQVANSVTTGYQFLLKSQVLGEKPNIATFSNPATGFSISPGVSSYIYNGTAMWSFGRNGAGLGQFTGNAITAKDADDLSDPAISNEGNHDGIMWIDNRMPDGIIGHDVKGRFLRVKVGGKRALSIGSDTVQVGVYTPSVDVLTASTLTVGGRIESLSGGYKFPDGSVQTTAATGTGNVFDSIVITPRATPPASPVVGTIYINSITKQAYWWEGSQWLVAW